MKLSDAMGVTSAPKEKKKETPSTPKVRKALTSNEIIQKIIEDIDPLSTTNPDDLFLRDILTANRGTANRNQTYQRNIIRMVLNKLMEMGMIRNG